MKVFIDRIILTWQNAWHNKAFRKNLIFGILLLIITLVFTYFFLNNIDYRSEGRILNDWILKKIPAKDVSGSIVFFMASAILLFISRCVTNPNMVVTFLLAFTLLLATRILTISTTRLIAPPELIIMNDPIGDILYSSGFITQDLFYSGHTASLFLLYLCSYKKADRYYLLFSAIVIGVLLLIQHVHYTIDIVFAPFFAYGCFWLSQTIIKYQNAYLVN